MDAMDIVNGLNEVIVDIYHNPAIQVVDADGNSYEIISIENQGDGRPILMNIKRMDWDV